MMRRRRASGLPLPPIIGSERLSAIDIACSAIGMRRSEDRCAAVVDVQVVEDPEPIGCLTKRLGDPPARVGNGHPYRRRSCR